LSFFSFSFFLFFIGVYNRRHRDTRSYLASGYLLVSLEYVASPSNLFSPKKNQKENKEDEENVNQVVVYYSVVVVVVVARVEHAVCVCVSSRTQPQGRVYHSRRG
jgi:uncharacterized membrane protein YidH (DUF202 family)